MRTPFLQLPCWDSHLPGHRHPYHLPGPDWKGWQECWEVPQNQPHVPRRLRLCLRSSSGCRASSYCLHQQIETDPEAHKVYFGWLNQGEMWCFSSFFCLSSFSVFSIHIWEGGIVLFCFGLAAAALTVNFLWFIPGIWPALCGFPHQSGIPPCFLKSLRNIWGVRLRKPAVKGCTTYSCPQVIHWESWLESWGKRSQVIPTSWLSK